MAKVFAICGKICSGKTYYAKELVEKHKAILLSCDEVTKVLFDNDLGAEHDAMSKRIWQYFLKKAEEIVAVECSVVLDWGFWTKEDRAFVKAYFKERNIDVELHYIDIDDKSWKVNIEERNKNVLSGKGGCSYLFDDFLMNKLMSRWHTPTQQEVDVWVKVER